MGGTFLLVLLAVVTQNWGVVRVPLPGARPPTVSDEAASDVVQSLLRNVYHAFDYREEKRIYDVLDRCVVGDLLRETYLDTQRSRTLASQGGARVRVTEVTVVDCHSDSFPRRLDAVCTWNVSGSVGHGGHVHQRVNQYRAELSLEAVDGQWKVAAMDLLDEKRL